MSYVLHEHMFFTQLFLIIIIEQKWDFNGQYHAENKTFANNVHHQILSNTRYDKGLLTAVLRCAEVVGKKVPFLCLYKNYCFFIYYYKNALIFLENILVMFSSKEINIIGVNAPHALSGKILWIREWTNYSILIIKLILLC